MSWHINHQWIHGPLAYEIKKNETNEKSPPLFPRLASYFVFFVYFVCCGLACECYNLSWPAAAFLFAHRDDLPRFHLLQEWLQPLLWNITAKQCAQFGRCERAIFQCLHDFRFQRIGGFVTKYVQGGRFGIFPHCKRCLQMRLIDYVLAIQESVYKGQPYCLRFRPVDDIAHKSGMLL